MKRILLFLLTNIAVLVVLSIATSVLFGVFGITDAVLSKNGLNYNALLVFAMVFGMGGSLISLFMSKWVDVSDFNKLR